MYTGITFDEYGGYHHATRITSSKMKYTRHKIQCYNTRSYIPNHEKYTRLRECTHRYVIKERQLRKERGSLREKVLPLRFNNFEIG